MKRNINLQKNKKQIVLGLVLLSLAIISSFFLIKTSNDSTVKNIDQYNKQNLSNSISFSNNKYVLEEIQNKETKTINIVLDAKKSQINFEGNLLDSYTYNGISPGPIIRAVAGDTLNAILINNLNEDTTIHWHGLQVPNNMDGIPDITQESVKPGSNFTYTFKLNDPGIYWYHPHVNTAEQVGRGLYGILIVEEKDEKIKFDKDQLLILDDVRLDSTGQISRFGSMMDAHMSGRYGNTYFINGKKRIDITANKDSLLRIRLVNPANARIFQLAVEDHKFIVLGSDIGRIDEPYETDSLILAPGERAEILLYLDDNQKNNFNIFNLATRNKDVIGTLIYSDNKKEKDKKNENEKYYLELIKEKLNENLPDWSDKLILEPDIVFDLYSSSTEDGFKWTINGNYYPEKPDIQELEEGKFYKLRYTSKQRMVHPMHLHGQKFIILARNGVPVNDTIYRDTALVFPGESVDIGLIAEGEGSWVNHCHILEHAEAGMLGIVNIQ